jgi:multicomponent Na+:H+ antiporter subunit G
VSTVLEMALDVLSALLLLAGSVLTLIAAIGLFRMPDAYARIHVATKPATLGIACTLSGAVLQMPGASEITKLLLALGLQLWTVPAASHLLARAGRLSGLAPAHPDAIDAFTEGPPDGPPPTMTGFTDDG